MGIPLRVEPVPGVLPEVDGYRIPREEYALRDPGLTTDELAALHLAASAVQVEGLPATEGLLKLGGLVTEGAHDLGVHVAPAPRRPEPRAPVRGRVEPHARCVLRYHDEERTVDPYRLEFQRGRWYLTGYDHLRDEERNYRLDRIEGDGRRSPTARPSSRPPPPSRVRPAAPGSWAPRRPFEHASASTARRRVWAVQHVGPDHVVHEEADGSVVVELPVTNRAAFRSFVLSFLEHAEVLEPAELRDDLVAWLS